MSRSCSLRISILSLCVITNAVLGQDDARLIQTDDGSRFLLLPQQTRTVQWVSLHPTAGEPSELQGLALAVARASMQRGAGLEWERDLRRAPATGSRLVHTPGYLGIATTFPPGSLHRVAELLAERARRESLPTVGLHFIAARQERDAALRSTRHLGMLRRLLEAAESSDALRATYASPGPVELTAQAATQFYLGSQAPENTLNVICGGFDPTIAEADLRQVFSATSDSRESAQEQPPVVLAAPAVPQEDTPADATDTFLVGFPTPSQAPAEMLVHYLAIDGYAMLTDPLLSAGHSQLRVRCYTPLPGGILVLEVAQPGAEITATSPLLADLLQTVTEIIQRVPQEAHVEQVRAALQARRTRELRAQEGLALILAQRWAVAGTAPTGAIEEEQVTATALYDLAKNVLSPSNATLILPQSK